MLKNGQTYLANFAVFTPQDCLAIFQHYAWEGKGNKSHLSMILKGALNKSEVFY